jgi:hypothetical protein
MQFQMLRKLREAEEALERGIFHALDVPKAHVVGNEREHLSVSSLERRNLETYLPPVSTTSGISHQDFHTI